jgi:pyridine nucleotide-disulfide oxidoreductase family protein
VSPTALAPYSGMVPGWLAGHYRWEECCIDFDRLCRRAGALRIEQQVARIDPAQSEAVLEDGRRIAYDWTSIDIGSTLTPPHSEEVSVLPLRPLSTLCGRWERLLQTLAALPKGTAYRILMVGGGAAGVESMLAIQHHVTACAPHLRLRFMLASQREELLPGLAGGAARRLRGHLDERRIEVVQNFTASHIVQHAVISAAGQALETDAAIWATGAQAYRWPGESGLATDERGFIRIRTTLQSASHPNVFAAGDCAGWEPSLPKAGVFAVRMGPVLARNLDAALDGKALQDYSPQRRYLVLIGTGDRHAVGARGKLAWQGKWAWRWKEHIDRGFVEGYNEG